VNASQLIEEAIQFAADLWIESASSGELPDNLNPRDRVRIFSPALRKKLLARFPDLCPADDQVLLLIVAEGLARSGTSRNHVERALGIVLPR